MKSRLTAFILDVGVVAIIGAVITFLIFAKTTDFSSAVLIGFFYALAGVGIFRLITRLAAGKLTVFNPLQQWVLKGTLYTIGMSVAVLIGIVFQTILMVPADILIKMATDQLWSGLVYVLSLPFAPDKADQGLDANLRSIMITFFTVLMLIGLVSLVISLIEIRWREERQKRAVEQAELTALRAQIQPHFLFNTLNTIAALIKADPDRAESLLVQLSDMLRYLFRHSGSQTVPLKDELAFTHRFVTLLQARFGHSLEVDWQVNLARDHYPVPFLVFQPIIENAVQHGRPTPGTPLRIRIDIQQKGSLIALAVADDGRGIAPEKLKRLPAAGHALANISERLYLQFRQHNLMIIDSRPGTGTTVTINIPV